MPYSGGVKVKNSAGIFMLRDRTKSILLIYSDMSTFIQRDLEILTKNFEVKTLQYTGKKDMLKLVWGILTTDISISWFALGYATTAVFLSKLFNKKSIVIAGGWDVVNMPEIGYGAMQSSKRIRKTRFTLKHADRVLAVSESTKSEVLNWCPSSNVITIYNGLETDFYIPKKGKKNLVITVGSVTWGTVTKKGLETFVKSAKYLPDTDFVVIGKHIDNSYEYLKSISSPNVRFVGYVLLDELLELYQNAKVYVQVSAHESFGCSLAEAMLCECVPVTTNRGALPEVVGDTGFYVPYGEPKATAEAIRNAMKSEKGKNAREIIASIFPIEKREKELIKTIKEVLYGE